MSTDQSMTNRGGGPPTSDKTMVAALLLVIFLGALGVDRFYLGKVGQGIGRIVLTISVIGTIGTVIWNIISIVNIATGKETDAQGRPLAR